MHERLLPAQNNTENNSGVPVLSFLVKLGQKNPKSEAATRLLALNQSLLVPIETPNEVLTIFMKRSRFLLMFHNLQQIWDLPIEELEENKLLCVMLIIKKIHSIVLEVKISLSSFSNTFLSRYIADVEQFRQIIRTEIEVFNNFFENFMSNAHEFLRSCAFEFLSVKSQVENYVFDHKFFTHELLKFIVEIKKFEGKIETNNIEFFVSAIVDCLFADEIVSGFGNLKTEVEKYPYSELIAKFAIDDLIVMNSEKFRISWQLTAN